MLVSIPVCRHERSSDLIAFARYADTPNEDWLIGSVPGDPSLFVATGGSGHAYKVNLAWDPNLLSDVPTHDQFLPVIGRLVADAIQGVLPDHLVKKFAVGRNVNPESTLRIERRIDTTRRLDENSLSTEEDLLPF